MSKLYRAALSALGVDDAADALASLDAVGNTVGDLVHALWSEYQAFGWPDQVTDVVAARRAAAVLVHANSSIHREIVQNAMRSSHDLHRQLGNQPEDYASLAELVLVRLAGIDAEEACRKVSRSMFALVEFAQGGDVNRNAMNVIAFADGGRVPPEAFFQQLDNWGRYLLSGTAQAATPALVLEEELAELGAQLDVMKWPS
jgi:hypothetical protein